MRGKRCPRCGEWMRPVPDSVRTVRGGTWGIIRCPSCLHEEDAWKPRRTDRSAKSE